jgi:hypothetical protein
VACFLSRYDIKKAGATQLRTISLVALKHLLRYNYAKPVPRRSFISIKENAMKFLAKAVVLAAGLSFISMATADITVMHFKRDDQGRSVKVSEKKYVPKVTLPQHGGQYGVRVSSTVTAKAHKAAAAAHTAAASAHTAAAAAHKSAASAHKSAANAQTAKATSSTGHRNPDNCAKGMMC